MLRRRYNLGSMIAMAEDMARLLDLVAHAAKSYLPVLLLGAHGSGRDLIAHTIHDASGRAGKPLVVFDCRKRSPLLLEEALERHAGTVVEKAAGEADLLASVHGGVLLLQEVDKLPASTQARLMEFLESARPERAPAGPDIRLIATTEADLHAQMDSSDFRPDLFYRLSVMAVQLPPSLSRREDIAQLIEFLWEMGEIEAGALPGSPGETWLAQFRKHHSWSDSVRELQQAVLRVASTGVPPARWETLLPAVAKVFRQPRTSPLQREDIELLRRTADFAIKQFDAFGGNIYETIISQLERSLIQVVLKRCNGVKSKAAEILGFSLAVLNRKIRDLGLEMVDIAKPPSAPEGRTEMG